MSEARAARLDAIREHWGAVQTEEDLARFASDEVPWLLREMATVQREISRGQFVVAKHLRARLAAEERVAALAAIAETALRTILDIECGWCGPRARRNWDVVKKIATEALAADSVVSARVERLLAMLRAHHEYGPSPEEDAACPCCGAEVDENEWGRRGPRPRLNDTDGPSVS